MYAYLGQAYAAIDEAAAGNELVATQCRALITGYAHKYYRENANYEIVDVESVYTAPLRNLEPKGRISRKWTLAGKIDKLIKIDGEHFLVDHKTTSLDIADPSSNYWRVLRIDSQPRHYEILMYSNGIPLRGILWDVVKKPTSKPRLISNALRNSITNDGTYLGEEISNKTYGEIDVMERENMELYSIRLVKEIMSKSDRHFQRKSIALTKDELEQYNRSLWQVSEDMSNTMKRTEKTGCTPYNPSGCMMWNTPCQYLGLCSKHDTEDSQNWVRVGDVHPELEGEAEADGSRGLLTNSRAKCYQLCPMKHHYRYVMGLEKAEEQQKLALFFGNVWHTAMDAWWTAVSGYERRDDGDSN
tara:strand:+ start:114 stop:1187 length:1074 start_codon:yes stop_codon:yes gene_type:complete